MLKSLQIAERLYYCFDDTTRLRLLNIMRNVGELSTSYAAETLRCTQSKITRHLNHLEHKGLITHYRDGQWIKHYITPDWLGLIEHQLNIWDESNDLKDDIARYISVASLKQKQHND